MSESGHVKGYRGGGPSEPAVRSFTRTHGEAMHHFTVRSSLLAVLLLALSSPVHAQTGNGYRVALQNRARPAPRSVLSRPARLVIPEVSVATALKRLADASGVVLAYSPSQVEKWGGKAKCDCASLSVEEALEQILGNSRFVWMRLQGEVLIYLHPATRVEDVGPELPAELPVSLDRVLPSVALPPPPPRQQAEGTITGRVTDTESGEPMASVQVYLQGMSLGTLTQQNGRYLIQHVPAGTQTLMAERIGYRTESQQVTVSPNGTVVQDFALSQQALQLEEVIVTGTAGGTQKKAIGNAVGVVPAQEIVSVAPVANVQGVLEGREAGLSFQRGSGNIGTGSSIRIRGVNTLTLGNEPLIYVDGIRVDNSSTNGPNLRDGAQVSTLDDLSPDEIASIQVIKGPAAATLYGTEASAGVIQIITKRGQSGAPQFDISIRDGATWLPNIAQKVGMSYGHNPTTGQVDSFNIYLAEKAAGRNAFQTGPLQTYSISVRGGTNAVRYFLSGEFGDNQGIVSYNWEKKTNLRANVSIVPSDKVSLDASMGYVVGKTSFMQQRTGWGMWEQFQWANPEGRDRTLRGFLRARPEKIANNKAIRDMNRFTGSATLTYKPISWMTHKLVVGTDYLNSTNSVLFPRRTDPTKSEFGSLALGYLEMDHPMNRYNTLDYSASATYGLGDKYDFTSSFGAQYYARTNESVGGTGQTFPAPQITTLSGAAQTTARESFVQNKSFGMYVQQQVGINDRIFLTAAVRGDDNSAFGANYKAAIYPKFSATWTLSDESFWEKWKDVVNQFRLRSAWGEAGRQPATFAAVTLYKPEVGPAAQPAITTDVLGNPDVGPEVSSELEVGFDAAFFQDRISTEFTYYTQKVKDALMDIPVSPVSGFSGSQSRNLGQLSNWGWELTMNARALDRGAFAWDVGMNVSSTQNRVDRLGGAPATNDLVEGRPYPFVSARQIETVKLDPTTRNVTELTCDGGAGSDGRSRGGPPVSCNSAPLVQLGNGLLVPQHTASFNTTVTLFKNLRLYALVQWEGEHWTSLVDASCRHTCFYTSRAAVERPDEYAKTVAAIDRLVTSSPYTGWFNASFAKLREVSLSYTLPDELVTRIGASRASVNLAARNLWTIWQAQKDIGGAPVTDPEVRNANLLTSSNSNIPPLSSLELTLRASF